MFKKFSWHLQKQINKAHFKEQLRSPFFEVKTQSSGWNILLVFEKGMQQLLKKSYDTNVL